MSTIQCIMIIIAVSIDGFFAGAALGVAKIKLKPKEIVVLSTITFLMCIICGYLAKFSISIFNIKFINALGTLVLFSLGVAYLFANKKTAIYGSAVFLGIAVGTDACVASFALAASGASPIVIALGMMISHGVLVKIANSIGNRVKINQTQKYQRVGGILLIFIAIIKILI